MQNPIFRIKNSINMQNPMMQQQNMQPQMIQQQFGQNSMMPAQMMQQQMMQSQMMQMMQQQMMNCYNKNKIKESSSPNSINQHNINFPINSNNNNSSNIKSSLSKGNRNAHDDLNLIISQDIMDGYWDENEETKKIIDIITLDKFNEFKKKINALNKGENEIKIIYTILVIFYLKTNLSEKLKEYRLVINKANKFLQENGINYDDIIS